LIRIDRTVLLNTTYSIPPTFRSRVALQDVSGACHEVTTYCLSIIKKKEKLF